MNKQGLMIVFALFLIVAPSVAQETRPDAVRDVTILVLAEGKPVAGANVTVRGTGIAATTDAAGRATLKDLADGPQVLEIVAENFKIYELALSFPLSDTAERRVELEPNEVEVIVTTTRTGREIESTPTRVEAIDAEEIDEKSSMRSANVSMILNESTGIKVQQTSATTFTQSIRIQGLDGRYTQLLKDGFPAFGGFSDSLSILDIVPLDLKQVEIIKGASSTFYGGGAIAGVVNFVSKEPTDDPVTNLILNQTSALGTDVSAFHTRRTAKLGMTLLGSFNYQREYDADGDDFTELPRTASFSVNPRLFVYADNRTRLTMGNSTTIQSRKGGDLRAVQGQTAGRYLESHRSLRNITTFQFDRELSNGGRVVAKQSLAIFDREIDTPASRFAGRQLNSFTEVSYARPFGGHLLAFGFNAVYDDFREDRPESFKRNETRTTFGGFVQDTFDVTDRFSIEAGFRLDAVRDYGVFALPRVSLLYHLSDKFAVRATIGFGYKTPSVFTEDAETRLFINVLPVRNGLKAESSRGGTFDLNYRDSIGEKFTFSLNQMFFYTEIEDPLVLSPAANGVFRFSNSAGRVTTSGFETNLRASYGIAKLFAGYTYTNAKADYLAGDRVLPLTPKSKLNSALLFEKEEDFKAGLEAYFTGRQTLGDRSRTPSYWVVGIFGEKSFGKFSLFVNAENITDTRQSRFGQVVFPPFENPTFAEIYTHTEGRIFNGGIKLRF
ncbi:MAG: TonB-dependent receptor [Acidobacteria bacterium]|nr:TonB-dependent receptor [Acidobacteriota bacterium]